MIQERIVKLRKEVEKHDRLYDMGKPEITDSEYDALYLELVALEKDHPEFSDPLSPTNRIIVSEDDKTSKLLKVEHTSPMLSQEKATTFEEIEKFMERANGEVLVQQKLDGLTIVLRYDDHSLKQAITRGNGLMGEDVTHIVREIANVPKSIPYVGKIEVRGEVIMPYKAFEEANKDNYYSNPRNFASGQLRRIDANGIKELGLKVIAFDLITPVDRIDYDTEQLGFLESNGFEVVNSKSFPKSDLKEMKDWIDNYENEVRESLPHMIDGLVVKTNDLSIREKLGSTSKHPKWSIAYKFKSLDATTTLLDCIWSVGKQGQITPVAILEVVNIDNVNIGRASLHNVRNIKDKDIKINDRVIVKRANDVIPFIVGAIPEVRTGFEQDIVFPATCPACGEKTQYEGEHLYCINSECEPQLKGKLVHFASRDAMEIDGLADKTVEIFYDEGIVRSFIDIFTIKDNKDIITKLEGFGKKKFERIVDGVEASKSKDFNHVLYSLCIKNIGRSASKVLAKEFGSMDNILIQMENVPKFKERLLTIPDFGETMANNLIDFLSIPKNLEIIKALKDFGVNMEEKIVEKEIGNSPISGMNIAITGKLEIFTKRAELVAKIEELGGKVASGVTKNVNYLVNNDITSNSDKNKKAKDLGIPIITEQRLLEMLS